MGKLLIAVAIVYAVTVTIQILSGMIVKRREG